jgi:CBS domain containing-hemolysin-like protein
MEELGRVPQVGDVATLEGIQLRAEAVAHNSVTSVRVTLPVPAPKAPETPPGGES